MSDEAEAAPLTLYNLPGDIYDLLSDFLDNRSLFVFLTLSPRRISVSKYLVQQRQQRRWRQEPMEHWAKKGDLKGVQYLHHRLGRKCHDTTAMDGASFHGHLEVVQFLHSIGATCTTFAMDSASLEGRLDVVQYLHSIGAPCSHFAMDGASGKGHLAVVKFLHSIGATCTTGAMDVASSFGHLAVVQFLHSIGATCTKMAMDNAGSRGHLEVVQFLHKSYKFKLIQRF
jgi:hypothetical protein